MPSAALQNVPLMEGRSVGEDGWGPEMNANLRMLSALIQARAIDKDLATPPVGVNGAVYVIATGPTGAWAGRANQIARYYTTGATWEFYTPLAGWEIYMIDEAVKYRFNGTSWVALP